ncbi:MAG TPA: peptidylprolyl isomerase [Clostridia bacterium]|nr:peptidylprolyl isomerase [Clostridia bacterium]
MKKFLALLIAAIMILGIAAGCSLKDEPNADDPVNAGDIAGDTPVVTVDGEVVLTWADYTTEYNTYNEQFYQSSGAYLEDAGYADTAVSEIIDFYTEDAVIAYQAKKQGADQLTEEQQTELQAQIDDLIKGYDEYYRSQAEEEAADDASIDVDARVDELIAEEAQYYTGKEMTYDEFMDWLKDAVTDQFVGDLLKEKALQDVVAGDDYVETFYNDELASQTESYDATPANYLSDQEAFETAVEGAVPVLYVPEGYARVMDILVTPTGTLPDDYDQKLTDMSDLKEEYGQLAFDDAANGNSENAVRMAEILTEYAALKAETDAAHDEYVREAKEKIEAAYAELQAGTPFADVLAKYTENTKFTDNEIFRQKGALMYASGSDWSNAVIEAFKTLSVGSFSAVLEDDEGFHILYYVSDEIPGVRPLSDVTELIRPAATEQKKSEEWDALLTAWKADSSVVIDQDLVDAVKTAG